MQEGLFISFEGSEGCGKSTQLARLSDAFGGEAAGVLAVRDPGGTRIGEVIRHLLKHAEENRGMRAETELLLFAASRAQLVREVILPALAEKRVVLADRFMDSTSIYQGSARGLDAGELGAINRFAVGDCLPHLTFVLDVPVPEAMARLRRRVRPVGQMDRMEQEPDEFYERVRRGYLDLARREPGRVAVIDAAPPPDEVARVIRAELETRCHGFFARRGFRLS